MNDGVKVISANKGIQKQNTIGTQESRIHSTIPNHHKITQINTLNYSKLMSDVSTRCSDPNFELGSHH